MSKRINTKIRISLIINVIIVCATSAIVVSHFFAKSNPLLFTGVYTFKLFTTDSNILAALASLILIPFEIQILKGKREKIPHVALVIKYAATVSLMLTFTTVMVLLLPVYPIEYLLLGTAFYMHLFGPLAALGSFLFLETDSKISFPESFTALIPCILYGAVYFTQVIIIGEKNGGWKDFYTFNREGYWYITVIVVPGITYLIALLTRFIHNKMVKRVIK